MTLLSSLWIIIPLVDEMEKTHWYPNINIQIFSFPLNSDEYRATVNWFDEVQLFVSC